MTETGAWTGSWTTTAAPQPGTRPRPRRAAALRALLHAQSHLAGPADPFGLAEDDHHRLTAARAANDPARRYR
jgi:hypothetical protein